MTAPSARKGKNNPVNKIEIYIEELTLEGVSASERYVIGDALMRELEHLLQERGTGLLSSLSNSTTIGKNEGGGLTLENLSASSVSLKTGDSSRNIGQQVAQAVFGSLQSSLSEQRTANTDTIRNMGEA